MLLRDTFAIGGVLDSFVFRLLAPYVARMKELG